MRRPRSLRIFILLSLLLLPCFSAFGWGQHYLIMARSLQHPDFAYTSEKIPVMKLEDFLRSNSAELSVLFRDYYIWLQKKGSKQFKAQSFDASKADLAAFLKAARLHPKTHFEYVTRLLPGQKPAARTVKPEDVSPYLPEKDFFTVFEADGAQVSIASVLYTFIDEPDWQMDHELWQFADYGYGKPPYGGMSGETSKAPFHMQFRHESFIVRWFAPQVKRGMVEDRVELFSRLAKLAFQKGSKYWGYRFSAWAIHYIQDLSQIYHSRAVPHAGFFYYMNYVFSFGIFGDSKKEIVDKTTQVVANRHFLYEDFVAYGLEKGFTVPDATTEEMRRFLSEGTAILKENTVVAVMEKVMSDASDHSELMDSSIRKIFGEKRTNDPAYDLKKDPDYGIAKLLPTLNKDQSRLLLQETARDFANTSISTRTMIKLCGG